MRVSPPQILVVDWSTHLSAAGCVLVASCSTGLNLLKSVKEQPLCKYKYSMVAIIYWQLNEKVINKEKFQVK